MNGVHVGNKRYSADTNNGVPAGMMEHIPRHLSNSYCLFPIPYCLLPVASIARQRQFLFPDSVYNIT